MFKKEIKKGTVAKKICLISGGFGLGVIFALACIFLKTEDIARAALVFNNSGDCFLWFFTKLTPTYFSVLPKIWALWLNFGTIWANPSFANITFGILMTILVGLVCVIFSAFLIILYILLFIFFLVVLIILGVLSAIVFFFSIYFYFFANLAQSRL